VAAEVVLKALNLEYLLGWTARISLRANLTQVWEEAFPGEAMPESGGGR
jgi:hypothetical protein